MTANEDIQEMAAFSEVLCPELSNVENLLENNGTFFLLSSFSIFFLPFSHSISSFFRTYRPPLLSILVLSIRFSIFIPCMITYMFFLLSLIAGQKICYLLEKTATEQENSDELLAKQVKDDMLEAFKGIYI